MASTPWRASIAAPSTLRVCRCALMAALALALTALESLIPVPMPVPGMKLGIANVVTAAAAFWLGPVDVAVVLGVRIVLAAFLTGQL
ncbi:MAG: Gx transporter family protein, partial [Eggerthella lenta]